MHGNIIFIFTKRFRNVFLIKMKISHNPCFNAALQQNQESKEYGDNFLHLNKDTVGLFKFKISFLLNGFNVLYPTFRYQASRRPDAGYQ